MLDTDDTRYGGSGAFAGRPPIVADGAPRHGQERSAPIDLGPLSVTWIEPVPELEGDT